MLKDILTSTPVLGLLAGLLLSGIAFLGRKAILVMATKPKLMPLEPLVEDAETALSDAVKTAEADLLAGKTPAQIAIDAGNVALSDAKADIPDAEKAALGEVSVLISGVPTSAVSPSGATVNLPSPSAPKTSGVVSLLVVGLIALGVAIAGGITALLATGNGAQVLSCVEQAANSNPAGLGQLVSSLSTDVAADAESAISTLGPTLAKCVLTDLWSDTQVVLARNAVLKANTAPLVAPAPQIKAAAQALCVRKNWYPPGVLVGSGTTGGSAPSGSTSSTTGG